MLEKMVGQETIRAGLTNYLKKHRFGNAVTGDLWQSISEAWNGTQRNFSIPEMMDTWTLQVSICVFYSSMYLLLSSSK
jgi:aminopeptidase N